MSAASDARVAGWSTTWSDAAVALAVRPAGGWREGRVAAAGADGTVGLLSLADGSADLAVSLSGGLLDAAWSADGRLLAACGPRGAWLIDEGGTVTELEAGGWCSTVRWSSGGMLAVAVDRECRVFAPSGCLAWVTAPIASTVTGVVWRRRGREVAVCGYGGISSFQPGRPTSPTVFGYEGSLLALAETPDGRWLVSGNQDASIHVWRTRDGSELEMGGLPFKVTAVSFDSSSRWLAATGAPDITVWDFSGKGPGGTRPRLLELHPSGATVLAWHPDAPRLVSGGRDGAVGVWTPSSGRPGRPARPERVHQLAAPVLAVAWCGDAAVLASTSDGGIHLLDAGAA